MLGGVEFTENPRGLIGPAWLDFVELWYAGRDRNGGMRNWPDAGGLADQAAWTLEAFGMLAGAEMRLEKLERGEAG